MQGTDHSQLIAAGEYAMHQLFIVFVGVFLGGQGAGQFFMYSMVASVSV